MMLNISRLFSMRMSRICTDAFRETRGKRKIDDFWFNWQYKCLIVEQFHGPSSFPENVHAFLRSYSRCAHALLQPVT